MVFRLLGSFRETNSSRHTCDSAFVRQAWLDQTVEAAKHGVHSLPCLYSFSPFRSRRKKSSLAETPSKNRKTSVPIIRNIPHHPLRTWILTLSNSLIQYVDQTFVCSPDNHGGFESRGGSQTVRLFVLFTLCWNLLYCSPLWALDLCVRA